MINDICSIFAPSGNEELAREFIMNQIPDIFDEVRVDNIGNLILRSGNGGVCIECGMDSCGIMIVSVADGKPRFAGVGGINAEYLVGKKIVFENGDFGIVRYDGKNALESKISDLYLEGCIENLAIGDFGMVDAGFCQSKDKMFASGLGNRVGMAAVLTAVKKRGAKLKNVTVLFSAQKRLGSRGIQAFFSSNQFDKVITVDGAECKNGIKSGSGCFFVLADKAGVCKREFANEVKKTASENGIDLKTAIIEQDICMGYIMTSGKGTNCGAIAIPVEHKNRSFEGVSKHDFDEAVQLLEKIMNG